MKLLVKSGSGERIPFGEREFDFVFSGEGSLTVFAAEIAPTMKHCGFAVFHITSIFSIHFLICFIVSK